MYFSIIITPTMPVGEFTAFLQERYILYEQTDSHQIKIHVDAYLNTIDNIHEVLSVGVIYIEEYTFYRR